MKKTLLTLTLLVPAFGLLAGDYNKNKLNNRYANNAMTNQMQEDKSMFESAKEALTGEDNNDQVEFTEEDTVMENDQDIPGVDDQWGWDN